MARERDRQEASQWPTCCICGKRVQSERQLNDAWPYAEGKCCESCNWLYVIPQRIGKAIGGCEDGEDQI